MTAQVNEEVVPAFFFRFGAHRDAATSLFMRGMVGGGAVVDFTAATTARKPTIGGDLDLRIRGLD
jgi:hypothetical protein